MITPLSQAARRLIPHRLDVQLSLLTPIECRVACVFAPEGRRHTAAALSGGPIPVQKNLEVLYIIYEILILY